MSDGTQSSDISSLLEASSPREQPRDDAPGPLVEPSEPHVSEGVGEQSEPSAAAGSGLSAPSDVLEEGRRYGPVPTPTAERATELLSSDELIGLLLPPADVVDFAREPEPWEIYHERFDELEIYIERIQSAGTGALRQVCTQITQHDQWHTMRRAASERDVYREAIVEGLARRLLAARERDLRDYIRELGRGRDVLTQAQQGRITGRGRELHLSGEAIERVQSEVADELGLDVQLSPPLVEPDHAACSAPIRRVRDIATRAEHDLESVIEDLTFALERGNARFWFHDHRDHDIYAHFERVQDWLDRADGDRARERALVRGAWELIWGAGIDWLDLGWRPDGSRAPVRIETRDELIEHVETRGLRYLEEVAELGLLDRWMAHHPDVDDTCLDLAQTAAQMSREAPQDGSSSIETTGEPGTDHETVCSLLHSLAWRLGWRAMELEGRRLDSIEAFTRFDPEETDVQEALLIARRWLRLVHGAEKAIETVESIVISLTDAPDAPDDEERARLMFWGLQWCLGDDTLEIEDLECSKLQPAALLETALDSPDAYQHFVRGVASRVLPTWYLTRRRDAELADTLAKCLRLEADFEEDARHRALWVLAWMERTGDSDTPGYPSTSFDQLDSLFVSNQIETVHTEGDVPFVHGTLEGLHALDEATDDAIVRAVVHAEIARLLVGYLHLDSDGLSKVDALAFEFYTKALEFGLPEPFIKDFEAVVLETGPHALPMLAHLLSSRVNDGGRERAERYLRTRFAGNDLRSLLMSLERLLDQHDREASHILLQEGDSLLHGLPLRDSSTSLERSPGSQPPKKSDVGSKSAVQGDLNASEVPTNQGTSSPSETRQSDGSVQAHEETSFTDFFTKNNPQPQTCPQCGSRVRDQRPNGVTWLIVLALMFFVVSIPAAIVIIGVTLYEDNFQCSNDHCNYVN